jgi:hypothetical protein
MFHSTLNPQWQVSNLKWHVLILWQLESLLLSMCSDQSWSFSVAETCPDAGYVRWSELGGDIDNKVNFKSNCPCVCMRGMWIEGYKTHCEFGCIKRVCVLWCAWRRPLACVSASVKFVWACAVVRVRLACVCAGVVYLVGSASMHA